MTLHWKPVAKTKVRIPEGLSRILRLHWLTGTTTRRIERAVVPHTAETAIAYLQGLRDANVTGADILLDAINEHGQIEIWLE